MGWGHLAPKMAICIALVLRDYAAQIEVINKSLRELTLRIVNDPSGLVVGNYRDWVLQGHSPQRLDRVAQEVEFQLLESDVARNPSQLPTGGKAKTRMKNAARKDLTTQHINLIRNGLERIDAYNSAIHVISDPLLLNIMCSVTEQQWNRMITSAHPEEKLSDLDHYVRFALRLFPNNSVRYAFMHLSAKRVMERDNRPLNPIRILSFVEVRSLPALATTY